MRDPVLGGGDAAGDHRRKPLQLRNWMALRTVLIDGQLVGPVVYRRPMPPLSSNSALSWLRGLNSTNKIALFAALVAAAGVAVQLADISDSTDESPQATEAAASPSMAAPSAPGQATTQPAAPGAASDAHVSFDYWLGPTPIRALAADDGDELVPAAITEFAISQSPGDWFSPDRVEVDRASIVCTTGGCAGALEASDEELKRTIWLILRNEGSEAMEAVRFFYTTSIPAPVESDRPFEVVAPSSSSREEVEQLGNIRPGEGVIIPLASVLRLSTLGLTTSIPLGEVRAPAGIEFIESGKSDPIRVDVRPPSDGVLSGGEYVTEGEIFEGGG